MDLENYSDEIKNILQVQDMLLNIDKKDLYTVWKTMQVLGFFKSSHGVKFIVNEVVIALQARWKNIKTYAKFLKILYDYTKEDPLLNLIPTFLNFPFKSYFPYFLYRELIKEGFFSIDYVTNLLPNPIATNTFQLNNRIKHGFTEEQWAIFIFFCDLIKEKYEGYYLEVINFIETHTKDGCDEPIEIKNTYIANIIKNFSTYENNNFDLLSSLFETGWTKDTFAYHLIIDDLDYLQDSILKQDITIDSIVYPVDTKNTDNINPFALPYIKNATLLEFTAFYSSITCFKFLILNNAKTTPQTISYLFSSDNLEIVKMYDQLKLEPINGLQSAIRFKHNDVINWIYLHNTQRQVDRNKYFAMAMRNHNLEVALTIMDEKPVDVNGDGIANSVIEMDSIELLKLFKSKGCNIRSLSCTLLACKNGNSEILKFLLDNHAKSQGPPDSDTTPLIEAIKSINPECVKLLLEKGVDPNTSDKKTKKTCLIIACENPTLQIVQLLVEHGAYVNAADNDSKTPVVVAASHGFVDIVKYLIESGADYDYTPSLSNDSPLTAACKNGHIEIVKYLISIGCDPTDAQEPDALPVKIASKYQRGEILDFLLQSSETETSLMSQLLLAAIQKRDLNSIKALAKKKFTFESLDSQNRIALHYAAETNGQILEFLINYGGDVNARDEKRVTPLHCAVSKNNYECTKVLLKMNADINAQTSVGYTPIRIAAQNKKFSIVQLLLSNDKNKPNLEIRDKLGNTPLLSVCNLNQSTERADMITILLNAGADPNTTNNRNMNSLYVLLLRNPRLSELNDLIAHSAEINVVSSVGIPAMHQAVQNLNVFNFLLEHGGNIKIVSKSGDTCLHAAAETPNVEIAETLIASGINVNAKNKKGRTPIFNAIKTQTKDMIDFLMKRGANINEEDNDGNNALLAAMRSEKVPNLEYVIYLNDIGIDLWKKNKNRENLMSIAKGLGMEDIVVYLKTIKSEIN